MASISFSSSETKTEIRSYLCHFSIQRKQSDSSIALKQLIPFGDKNKHQ